MRQVILISLMMPLLWGFEYGLAPQKLSNEVYCFFGAPQGPDRTNNGNMVNTCYLDGKGAWLVIDSGPTYRYAKEAYSAMQKVKKQPVALVVNTHAHDDHWLGNCFYKAHNCPIAASKKAYSQMQEEGDSRMRALILPEAFGGTETVLPDRVVDEDTTVRIGATEVRLLKLSNVGHTGGDLAVYVPGLKTVFAGDLVFNDRVLSLRDGEVDGWLWALEKLAALDAAIIVGGHGFRYDDHAPDATQRYLTRLKARVQQAIAEDRPLEEISDFAPLSEFAALPLYDELHGKNLYRVYQKLEWEE